MSKPLRVLLVEDSEHESVLFLRALRKGGYDPQARRVESGAALADALEQHAWDLILGAYELRRFTAQKALAVRDARRPDLPFIVVADRLREEAIFAIIQAGAYDCVQRSDLGMIVPAVARALRDAAAHAEQRRAEAALRESEERFALAVRGSNDGIWDWNLITGEVYYAPRFKEILGFAAEDDFPPAVEAFRARLHPDDLPLVRDALAEHFERRAPFSLEVRIRAKQGEYRWVYSRGQALWDAEGKAVRMAGSLTDLTERKRVEEELRDKLELIQQQREAIRVLSTPIIEVWEGVLMTPVLGVLDRDRAAAMMESLLDAVVRARCRQVIIDLTGVESMDAATADHVLKLVSAVELLGAQGMVVGLKPGVAQAIVACGIDLSRVTTLSTLRAALQRCMPPTRAIARGSPGS